MSREIQREHLIREARKTLEGDELDARLDQIDSDYEDACDADVEDKRMEKHNG